MPNEYYDKNKEKFHKEAHERYLNLSEEEKKWKKICQKCQNFTEEEKEKSVNIIVNVIKTFLNIKKKLIKYTRNYYLIFVF